MHTIFSFTLFLLFTFFNSQKNILIVDKQINQIDSTGTVNNLSLKYETGFDLQKFKKFEIKNKIVFLNQTSGIVYQMKNDSIVRIDNSYDDKIHTDALDFVHRDTLFRFGGYGYFDMNQNLIFYDEKINEWDIINYKNRDLIEPFSDVGVHFFQDDKLYVFGYVTTNHIDNSVLMIKKGFVLDLNEKKIIETYNLKDSMEFPRLYFDLSQKHILLFYSKRKSLILNKETLELYSYRLNVNENNIVYGSDFSIIKDKLYFEIIDVNKKPQISSLNIDSLISNMKKEESFIKSNWDYFFYLLVILTGLGFVFIIKNIYFKKKLISVNEKTLNYGKIKIELNDKMIEVLSLLLNQEKVSNSHLLDIFYVKNQNRIHINREKNNCIDRINLMFELKTNKQLIQKEKSLLDNRMIDYYINKDLI